MRVPYLSSLSFFLGLVVFLPNEIRAQGCGECVDVGEGSPYFVCACPCNKPEEPPYCDGVQIGHIHCWTCGPDEEQPRLALRLQEFSPDGSVPERRDMRAALRLHPTWGRYQATGQAVVFGCNGAVVARQYDESALAKARERSALITL